MMMMIVPLTDVVVVVVVDEGYVLVVDRLRKAVAQGRVQSEWHSQMKALRLVVPRVLLRDGSSPLAGAFTLAAGGEVTDSLAWDQGALEVESELEELSSIGDVSVRSSLASLQRIPGAWATLGRDATAANRGDVAAASRQRGIRAGVGTRRSSGPPRSPPRANRPRRLETAPGRAASRSWIRQTPPPRATTGPPAEWCERSPSRSRPRRRTRRGRLGTFPRRRAPRHGSAARSPLPKWP